MTLEKSSYKSLKNFSDEGESLALALFDGILEQNANSITISDDFREELLRSFHKFEDRHFSSEEEFLSLIVVDAIVRFLGTVNRKELEWFTALVMTALMKGEKI